MQSTIKQTLWGTSERLFLSDRRQIELIRGGKGGASSLHRHLRKVNEFRLIAGAMRIHIEQTADPCVVDLSIACPVVAVPAGVLHRMEFIEDSVAIEIYEPATGCVLDPDDIERPNGQDGRAPADAVIADIDASLFKSWELAATEGRVRGVFVDEFERYPQELIARAWPNSHIEQSTRNPMNRRLEFLVVDPSFDVVDTKKTPPLFIYAGEAKGFVPF